MYGFENHAIGDIVTCPGSAFNNAGCGTEFVVTQHVELWDVLCPKHALEWDLELAKSQDDAAGVNDDPSRDNGQWCNDGCDNTCAFMYHIGARVLRYVTYPRLASENRRKVGQPRPAWWPK